MTREISMQTGIYAIINKINNKRYIGSALWSFNKRCKEHDNLLKRGKHFNAHLQRSWNKYGSDNFEFNIIEICSPETCEARETWYLNNTICDYNICKVGRIRTGVKTRDETKEKLRISKLGSKNPMFGKTGKLNPSSKQVRLLNKTTQELSHHESIINAAKYMSVNIGTLRNILNGISSGVRILKNWEVYIESAI